MLLSYMSIAKRLQLIVFVVAVFVVNVFVGVTVVVIVIILIIIINMKQEVSRGRMCETLFLNQIISSSGIINRRGAVLQTSLSLIK